VYLVTDDELPRDRLLAGLDAALAAGIDVVQFRTKQSATRSALRLGAEVAQRCAARGALLVVNDRADIAVALRAGGLHVGQDDLPPAVAREVVGGKVLLGLSVSTVEEAAAAEGDAAVDYVGFGAIYPTATKPDAEYAGLELLRAARERVTKPLVAIGGITLERAAEVIAAGADCVAVVSAIFRAPEPGRAAEQLLACVTQARGPARPG